MSDLTKPPRRTLKEMHSLLHTLISTRLLCRYHASMELEYDDQLYHAHNIDHVVLRSNIVTPQHRVPKPRVVLSIARDKILSQFGSPNACRQRLMLEAPAPFWLNSAVARKCLCRDSK